MAAKHWLLPGRLGVYISNNNLIKKEHILIEPTMRGTVLNVNLHFSSYLSSATDLLPNAFEAGSA
jgi:hypothetical protein